MRRLALVLLVSLLATPARAQTPSATLDKTAVPAAGRHSAILKVPSFGRYAVTVASAQGTALQIVDRMAGPGAVAGAAGEKDGRLDVFLERGEYQVVTHGHRNAKGEARLAVHESSEKNAPRPPLLVELKPVAAALEDHQQLSYWLEVGERRPVALEAAGRSLADLRLWRDGTWLVDASPVTLVTQPAVGQPLLVCRLTTVLEPGLYLLTAYGGLPQPWAEDTGAQPFHLRFGIPRLPEAGRRRLTVSPFGVDRFRVPGNVTYYRLELPEARPASLQAGWLNPKDPFRSEGALGEIGKNSVPPVTELRAESDGGKEHLVTVTAPAGQPYLLQHFDLRTEYAFRGSGDHWLSTIHSGHPADSVDATAILVRSTPGARRTEPMLSQTIELDSRTGWARRANLLGPLSLFLRVKEAGRYEVVARGVEARVRVEPFFIYRPEKYEPPPLRVTPSTWDLDAGYYVLTAEPLQKGIVDLGVRPLGAVVLPGGPLAAGMTPAQPVRAAARFGAVSLDVDRHYTVFINDQPEVSAGLILRKLPIDLTDALAVSQQAGETVAVPFQAPEAGRVRAEAEDGSLLDVSVDDGAWQKEWEVAPGAHTAAVRHAGAETIQYNLRLEPTRLRAETPLPALPDAALAALPQFPVLTDEQARYFDLARNATETFVLKADRPGLYRLESTGLLATEGNLRTRTITSFARESQNGVGRNFLLQQYLREGEYEVSVAAKGLSTGHLGLALTRTAVQNGGFLTLGSAARTSLAAGEAVAYRFKITTPGEFRVRSLGLGRGFRCRLEDDQGWPVVAPGGAADVSAALGPGLYRLVVLPERTAARVVTLIESARRSRVVTKGHGPHRLALARQREHVWLEPEGDGRRRPDVWELSLPAAIDATVELTGEMQADLVRVAEDGSRAAVAFVPPGRGWKGTLGKGRYRLEAVCARRNNRVAYQIAVVPEPLVAGLDREVTAPVDVPVSVGATGLVELSSFGSADVRARLYDASGRLIAGSDDRPDDWNFAIATSLTAGSYRLRIDPVGVANATCTVSMRVPREEEKPALALPAELEVGLRRAAVVYPLTLAARDGLLLVAARSDESVGVAVETSTDAGWRTVGSGTGRLARIEVPLAEAGAYRLRLWSLDRRDSPVRLTATVATPSRVSESQLGSGVTLAPVPGLKPDVGVAVVGLDRPGLFRAEDGGLRWSAARGDPARAAADGTVVATGALLWVVGDLPPGRTPAQARASRIRLGPGADVQFLMPAEAPALCDLDSPGGGPVLVRASSRGGQPGLSVGDAGAAAPAGRGMAPAPRAAVAVALRSSRPTALTWTASPASEPFEVRLEQWSFAAPRRERFPAGSRDGSIEGVSARGYDLANGSKRLHLALGDGLVAVLSKGDAVTSVHWAGGGGFVETVETEADQLTLLHTGAGEDRFAVEAIPMAPGTTIPAVAVGASYERAEVRAGTVRLALAAGEGPRTLHVRGHRAEPVFIGATGRVSRGADVPADPLGGTLLVPHGPGLVLVWADRPGEEARDLWSRAGSPAPQPLEPPAHLALGGTIRAFRLKQSAPVMLHLRTATPVVTLVTRGASGPEVEVHPRGGVLDAYLPAGVAEIVLRGVAGEALTGTAEFATTPVTPVDEGLGPEVLLAPGSTRLFAFTVQREGPVGLGVRASADVVEATLLSSDGRRLGEGVVQMPTLAPGTYLLALHARPDAAPVRARPALAGLKPPDTGPPADVVRRYLESGEAPPSFTAVHAEASAEGEEGREANVVEEEPTEGEEPPEEEEQPAERPRIPPPLPGAIGGGER